MFASHAKKPDAGEIHERLRHLLEQAPQRRTEDGRIKCDTCERAAVGRLIDGTPVCRRCRDRYIP